MGDRVRVWYLPQDPDDARLDDPLELWLAPGVSGSVGLLLSAWASSSRCKRASEAVDREPVVTYDGRIEVS